MSGSQLEGESGSQASESSLDALVTLPLLGAGLVLGLLIFVLPSPPSELLYLGDLGGHKVEMERSVSLPGNAEKRNAAEPRTAFGRRSSMNGAASTSYGHWTGRWLGEVAAYRGSALSVPGEEREALKPARNLAEENLIQDALGAFESGDAEHAVGMMRKHQRLFPDGVLREKREWLWIRALGRAGKGAAARRRGERFLRTFPKSEHRGSVLRLLATDYEF
jgi:hypothetical protein